MSTPKDYFGITCPEDGDFYICEGKSYEFVGCCMSDPCANDGQCPTQDLRVMTFQSNMYDELPPQLCPSGDGSAWYSCKFTEPPFLGCCINNPCDTGNFPGGCGRENLTQGRLAEDDSARYSFVSLPALASETGSVTAKSTSSPKPTATGASDEASTTSSSTSAPTANGQSDSALSTGAIVGIAVGAVAFAAICLAALCCWCGWSYRGRRNRQRHMDSGEQGPLDSIPGPQPSPYQDSFQYAGMHPSQYDKYQSPQMSQYDSPATLYADQGTIHGGYHSRHPSAGINSGLGVQEVEPQELPAASMMTAELPTDGDSRLYQPYDTVPASYDVAPNETPHCDSNMGFSPMSSPGLDMDNTGHESRRSARKSGLSQEYI